MNYMQEAYNEAVKAYEEHEIPVGAVIVKDGEIIARGHNRKERLRDVSSHAEIEALKLAAATLGRTNLEGCSLYCTLEPCPMCLSAVIQSNIRVLYYGAYDRDAGAVESFMKIREFPGGARVRTIGGLMEDQCAGLIKRFFQEMRKI